jgi:hypothetical protein
VLLKAIGTEGALAGTGTLKCESGILGGVLITADGTNAAVVIVRTNGVDGKQILDISTKQPLFIKAPIYNDGSPNLYYDVSGTGAAAQFFEFIS